MGRVFVLKRGSTIDDLADLIHHELREKLKYALLWGASASSAGSGSAATTSWKTRTWSSCSPDRVRYSGL